jgi:hypothetical protein
MKHLSKIVVASLPLSSLPAWSAVSLVAGWDDNFSGTTGWTPNHLAPQTTATIDASTNVGNKNWSQWNFNDQGASNDGTFGELGIEIANAVTTFTDNNENLSLNRSDGQLVFTLTNNSPVDRTVHGFHFDSVRRFSDSASAWTLAFGGAISGNSANGNLAQVGSMSGATAAQRNHSVDLTLLSDNVWEAGTNAVFTLSFTGSANSTLTGGGQELLVDNIGVTAELIPEPSSLALVALSGLALLTRRRPSHIKTTR